MQATMTLRASSFFYPASGRAEAKKIGGVLLLLAALLACPRLTRGAGQEVHGEDSVFAGHGVAIIWGVLKGRTEEATQVILRIVPVGESFAAVCIEAADPFTQNRQMVLDGQPLRDRLDVRSPRPTFADFPHREIKLYRTSAEWQAQAPSLTIFYHGVPDTTPEFTLEADVLAYLTDALARIQNTKEGRKP